jgi:hypothetical protein
MPAPTLKVEIAFLQSGGAYVWSDVSSYVRSVEIERGISRDTDKYSAGNVNVALSNQQRYFDPTYSDVASTRTNYILNPSFESHTLGWVGRNGSMATSPLDDYSGTSCCLFTISSSATTAGIALSTAVTATLCPVTVGLTYTSSIYVKDVNTSKQYAAYVDWYNSGGSYLGSGIAGTATTVNSSTWTRVSVTGVAPAGAAYARSYCYSTTSFLAGDAGKQVKFDAALFEEASSAGLYFDGDSILAGHSCSWTGTASASSSFATVYVSPFYGQVSPTGAIKITSNSTVIFYGSIDNWSFDFPENGFDGIATVNAFDSLSELAKRYYNGGNNFPIEQTTGERISYALDRPEISWNSALQDIDQGVNLVQDAEIADGTNALSYIQEVADAEMGDVFCSRDGKITFRDRRYLDYSWNAPTYRYNLCNCPNFEGGLTSYWTIGTLSSTRAKYGSKSLQGVYSPTPNETQAKYSDTDASKFSASGAGSYTASLWIYPTNINTFIQLEAFNGGSSIAFANDYPVVTINTWNRIDITLSIPSAFTKLELFVTGSSSSSLWVDGVLIEKSASVNDYFDGTIIPPTATGIRYTSAWDAAVNLSTSTLATQTLNTSPSPITLNLSDYSGSDIPVSNISTIYASENLFNRIVLEASGSVEQLAEDTALQSIYGIRTYTAAGLLNLTDPPVLANAYEMLTTYSKPEFRASDVQLELHGLSTANQNSVLAADLRDTIKLTFKPARTGTQMVKTYAIIGVLHSIRESQHTLTYRIASLQNTPFRLDSVPTGVLDTNVLGYPTY